jgi:uncharacterized membrane protein
MPDLTIQIPYRPSLLRTAVKTATYRFFNFSVVLLITYALTGDLHASLAVSGMELIIKLIIYFSHERLWARIDLGKGR